VALNFSHKKPSWDFLCSLRSHFCLEASCSDFDVVGEVHTRQEYVASVTTVDTSEAVIAECLGMLVEVAASCYNHPILIPSSNSKGRYMMITVEKMVASVACRNPSTCCFGQIFAFHAAKYLDLPSKDSLAA